MRAATLKRPRPYVRLKGVEHNVVNAAIRSNFRLHSRLST